jgi:hypothetical protein
MFRNRGVARTFKQNLRLAVFLSFTAGLVNIGGLLALGVKGIGSGPNKKVTVR